MRFIIAAVLSLAFACTSYAQSRRNEIIVMPTEVSFISAKPCKNCDSGSALTGQVAYLYHLQGLIQVGGEGGVRILSKEYSGTGSSETLIDIVGVGVYNLESDFANSIFAKAGIGFYATPKDNGNGYENKLGLFVGAGKRFAWFNNVSFSPELRLVKRGDIDMGIQVDILKFSLVW